MTENKTFRYSKMKIGQSNKWGIFERENPGICYEYGDPFLYLCGGRDVTEKKMTNDFRKYDVINLKWHIMPNMKNPRYNPGLFLTKDKKFLYVFGG